MEGLCRPGYAIDQPENPPLRVVRSWFICHPDWVPSCCVALCKSKELAKDLDHYRKVGWESPTFIGWESPTFIGWESPTFIGWESPTFIGWESPTFSGWESPTFIGWESPTFIGWDEGKPQGTVVLHVNQALP